MTKIELKIEEMSQAYVGKGVAIVDPKIIGVPNPDVHGMEMIFKIHAKKKPLADDVDLKKLVEMAKGFSGAEIEEVCNRAALLGVKRFVENKEKSVKSIKITQKYLEHSIGEIKKTNPLLHFV